MPQARLVRCTSRAIVNADHFNVMQTKLSPEISEKLATMAESGMGYQVISVKTKNGDIFDGVIIVQGEVVVNENDWDKIPFNPLDIVSFELTHDRSGKSIRKRA